MNAGWDRFLTAQDKEVLANTRWAKQKEFGLGKHPALVIVDAYYGALGLPRKPILEIIKEWPVACGAAGWDAIDATVPLLDEARHSGVPVYFLTGTPAGPGQWNRKPSNPTQANPTSPRFHQIVDELKPLEGEVIIEKDSPSGFIGTDLAALLHSQGCDTIVLCGETTSGCVRATALDGCVAGFTVGIVSDCCFDRTEASHWINLFDLNQKYGDVLESTAVLSYFKSVSPAV